MKKLFFILSIAALFLYGCGQSFMKVGYVNDSDPYVQYGKYSSRNVYYDFAVSDSIKELWTEETNGSFSTSSVSVYGGFVFVSDLSGRVTAYNLLTGKKAGEAKSKGSVYGVPYVHKNILLFITSAPEKNISVLNYWDIAENALIREVEVKGRVNTESVVIDSSLIFCTENGIVYRYDLFGAKEWECKTSSVIHSSPVLDNNKVYFGNDNGEIVCVSADKGNILFRKKTGGVFLAGGVVSEGNLFIADDIGNIYSLKSSDGTINWKYSSGEKVVMTPSVDKENLYFGNLAGDYFALNKKTGTVIWKQRTGKLFNAAPAVTQNYLLVPDLNKKLYFVDKNSGSIVKTIDFEGRVKLTPVIINKKIVIMGSDNGVLNAYEFE